MDEAKGPSRKSIPLSTPVCVLVVRSPCSTPFLPSSSPNPHPHSHFVGGSAPQTDIKHSYLLIIQQHVLDLALILCPCRLYLLHHNTRSFLSHKNISHAVLRGAPISLHHARLRGGACAQPVYHLIRVCVGHIHLIDLLNRHSPCSPRRGWAK